MISYKYKHINLNDYQNDPAQATGALASQGGRKMSFAHGGEIWPGEVFQVGGNTFYCTLELQNCNPEVGNSEGRELNDGDDTGGM